MLARPLEPSTANESKKRAEAWRLFVSEDGTPFSLLCICQPDLSFDLSQPWIGRRRSPPSHQLASTSSKTEHLETATWRMSLLLLSVLWLPAIRGRLWIVDLADHQPRRGHPVSLAMATWHLAPLH